MASHRQISKSTFQPVQSQQKQKHHPKGPLNSLAKQRPEMSLEEMGEARQKLEATGSTWVWGNNAPPETTPQQIQAKLTLGEVGDEYEQEADTVAAEVVEKINAPSAPGNPNDSSGEENSQSGEATTPSSTTFNWQAWREQAVLRDQEQQQKQQAQWWEHHQKVARVGSNADNSETSPQPIQRKLTEGETEQEAEATETEIAEKSNAPASPEDGDNVQREGGKTGGVASSEIESKINSAKGSGQALAPDLQGKMGEAMGADFSGVKVHTDGEADRLNRSLESKAFATGKDVFFRQGAYESESESGQELIAHELTHVLQQGAGGEQVQGKCDECEGKEKEEEGSIQAKLTIGEVGDKYEQEADAVAAEVVKQINSPSSNESIERKTDSVVKPTVEIKPSNSSQLHSQLQRQTVVGSPVVNSSVTRNLLSKLSLRRLGGILFRLSRGGLLAFETFSLIINAGGTHSEEDNLRGLREFADQSSPNQEFGDRSSLIQKIIDLLYGTQLDPTLPNTPPTSAPQSPSAEDFDAIARTFRAANTLYNQLNYVLAVQALLGLTQDGVYGAATAEAVYGWQKYERSLGADIDVDGEVGPETWRKMFPGIDPVGGQSSDSTRPFTQTEDVETSEQQRDRSNPIGFQEDQKIPGIPKNPANPLPPLPKNPDDTITQPPTETEEEKEEGGGQGNNNDNQRPRRNEPSLFERPEEKEDPKDCPVPSDALDKLEEKSYIKFRVELWRKNLELGKYGVKEQEVGETFITNSGPNPAVPQKEGYRYKHHTYELNSNKNAAKRRWYVIPETPLEAGLFHGFPRIDGIQGKEAHDLKSEGEEARWIIAEENVYHIVCEEYNSDGELIGLAQYRQVVLNKEENERLEKLQEHIERVDSNIGKIKDGEDVPIKAIHFGDQEEETTETPLSLYIGQDSKNDGFKLLDLTPGASKIEYGGNDAENAIKNFELDNEYPPCLIQWEVEENKANALGLEKDNGEMTTNGSSRLGFLSEKLSLTSLVFVVLGFASLVNPLTRQAAPRLFALASVTDLAASGLSIANELNRTEPSTASITIDVLGIVSGLLDGLLAIRAISQGDNFRIRNIEKFLTITPLTLDAGATVIITVEAGNQIQDILDDTNKSRNQKVGQILRILSSLAVTGGFLALGAAGARSDLTGGSNLDSPSSENTGVGVQPEQPLGDQTSLGNQNQLGNPNLLGNQTSLGNQNQLGNPNPLGNQENIPKTTEPPTETTTGQVSENSYDSPAATTQLTNKESKSIPSQTPTNLEFLETKFSSLFNLELSTEQLHAASQGRLLDDDQIDTLVRETASWPEVLGNYLASPGLMTQILNYRRLVISDTVGVVVKNNSELEGVGAYLVDENGVISDRFVDMVIAGSMILPLTMM